MSSQQAVAAATSAVGDLTVPVAAGPIASLRGVGRRFDDVVALEGVNLEIEPGTIVGVIGPSGAGKTTAIRLLTGALRPTEGEARVLGDDPTRLRTAKRARIGFMPQHISLYDDLTVKENLDFVASLYGLFFRARRRRIHALLEWLDLSEAAGRRAGRLSGGMRRRLQLACALVHDPDLVFLDEPTAGIDPLVRQAIWQELHRLRDAGRTLVITTQYVPEAEECDVVALIAGGRLVAFAPPEALRRQAFGGQFLEVETSVEVDTDRLARVPRRRRDPAHRRAAPADPERGPDAHRAGGRRRGRGAGRDRDLGARGSPVVRRGLRAAGARPPRRRLPATRPGRPTPARRRGTPTNRPNPRWHPGRPDAVADPADVPEPPVDAGADAPEPVGAAPR